MHASVGTESANNGPKDAKSTGEILRCVRQGMRVCIT